MSRAGLGANTSGARVTGALLAPDPRILGFRPVPSRDPPGVLVRAARVGDGRPVGAAGPRVEAASGAGPASAQVSVAQGGT